MASTVVARKHEGTGKFLGHSRAGKSLPLPMEMLPPTAPLGCSSSFIPGSDSFSAASRPAQEGPRLQSSNGDDPKAPRVGSADLFS